MSKSTRLAQLLGTLLLSAAISTACGGTKEAEAPKQQEDHSRSWRDDSDGMSVMGEKGALAEDKVHAAIHDATPAVTSCLEDIARRNPLAGGDIRVFIQVNQSREVQAIYATESNLGDREGEKCIFSALKAVSWPKPYGGLVGEASTSFGLDPADDRRPAQELPADDFEEAIGDEQRAAIRECGATSLKATLYIATNGSVIGASATPRDESGEASIDCAVAELRQIKFPSPGSYTAKVQLNL